MGLERAVSIAQQDGKSRQPVGCCQVELVVSIEVPRNDNRRKRPHAANRVLNVSRKCAITSPQQDGNTSVIGNGQVQFVIRVEIGCDHRDRIGTGSVINVGLKRAVAIT